MIPKGEKTRFLQWCALTCMGGSERKQCPCACPRDCILARTDPRFGYWRKRAAERMGRLIATLLG